MLSFRRAIAPLIALGLLAAEATFLPAAAQEEAAANYIRALFDTSMSANATRAQICPHIAQFGRFAAGHSWQSLSAAEQSRFVDGFCSLAVEAVRRLAKTFPSLTLEMGRVSPAPQEMLLTATTVRARGVAEPWPVDWQIAKADGGLRVADLRVLGVSLGIFLRGLVPASPEAPQAATILGPWWQALDRAFPPQGGATEATSP